MMVEAMHLYRMIVVVYGMERNLIVLYMSIGWGMCMNLSSYEFALYYDGILNKLK